MIDLTYPISEAGSRYPTDPAPSVAVVPARIEEGKLRSGYTKLVIRTHHGTHIDAPAHKIPGGKTIEQYELGRFINRAVLIDLTPHLEPGEDYARTISRELLEQALTQKLLQRVQQERISALLFRTGFEGEAAAFLVEACERSGAQLSVVGLDSFSIDPKGTPDSPAHRPFLSKDILKEAVRYEPSRGRSLQPWAV